MVFDNVAAITEEFVKFLAELVIKEEKQGAVLRQLEKSKNHNLSHGSIILSIYNKKIKIKKELAFGIYIC